MKSRRTLVTPHFRIEEFDSHDGAHVPPARDHSIALLAEWWLEPMRAFFGPVTVHSGYRSVAHNREVGGVRNSVHLLRTALPGHDVSTRSTTVAAAADVTCATGSPVTWSAWARHWRDRYPHLGPRARGGIGTYPGFVHLDTAGKRDW